MDQNKLFKMCNKCNEIKSIDNYNVALLYCKKCYNIRHKETHRLASNKFYTENKDVYKSYYQRNKEKIIKYNSDNYQKKKKELEDLKIELKKLNNQQI